MSLPEEYESARLKSRQKYFNKAILMPPEALCRGVRCPFARPVIWWGKPIIICNTSTCIRSMPTKKDLIEEVK